MEPPPGGEAGADAAPPSAARDSVGSVSRRNALTVTWRACGHDGGESSDEGSGLVISRAPSLVGRLTTADGLAAGPDVVLRSPKGLLDFEDLEFMRELGARSPAAPAGQPGAASAEAHTAHTGAASAEGQGHVRRRNVTP